MNPNSLLAFALLLATGITSRSARAQTDTSAEAAPAEAETPVAPAATPSAPSTETEAPATAFEERIAKELGISGGLTAKDVAERGVATSYVIEARRADIARASAQVDRAFAAYVPRLQLLGRYTRLSAVRIPAVAFDGNVVNFTQPFNQWTFQAHLTIPVSDYFLRVRNAHDATKYAESAARKDLAASELSAAADAKTTYYAWVQARLSAIVAEGALEAATAHLTDVRHAFEAGTASQADVLGIEARVADSERLLAINQNLVARLEEQLRIIRHDPPSARYRIGESLTEDPVGSERVMAVDQALQGLMNEALRQRPEILALEHQVQASNSRAAVERAGAYPEVALFGDANYDNPNARIFPPQSRFRGSWGVGIQASWLVSDIPGSLSAARGESSVAESLLAQRRALTDQIRNEVTLAYTALADARASLATTARSLAAAEEAHRVRRVLFQNGRATSVEVLDAELELTRARLVAVTARIDLATARVRLDYALGRRGSETRSSPPG